MTRPSARYQRHLAAAAEYAIAVMHPPAPPTQPAPKPRYTEPLDQLLALAPVRDLTIWHHAGFWKARRGADLVEMAKTPELLVKRLQGKFGGMSSL